MKPNFALNFTDTSIALLHRTAKGWLKVAETAYDAPDLDDALDYMRKTALGLEPGGFSTKLVLPASQILYAEIEVTGADDAARRAVITRELEARTPYKAEEIVFDWSGKGKVLKVAAVARVTLDEAEGFANQHRFNPVSFVAIPEAGTFQGEPWFGTTAAAAEGGVERDRTAISLLGEGGRSTRKAQRQAEGPEAVTEEEVEAQAPADVEPAQAVVETVQATEQPQPEEAVTDHEAGADPQDIEEASAAADTFPIAPELPFDQSGSAEASLASPSLAADAAVSADDLSIREMFPDADWQPEHREEPELADPVPPAFVPRQPEPVAPAAATRGTGTAARGPSLTISGVTAVRIPAEADPATPAVPVHVDTAASAARDDIAAPGLLPADEEAPFTHVPDLGPLDDIAERPAASRAVLDPLDTEDDLPPAPSGALRNAWLNRRGAVGDEGGSAGAELRASPAPNATPAPAPAVEAPARAVAPPAPAAARAVAPPAPRGGTAARAASRLGAGLVTATSIPGGRKGRNKVSAQPAPRVAAAAAATATAASGSNAAEEAARSLARSPFAQRPQRGKPRHLGLILTAILLLCLALVAAWSSLFLASHEADDTPAVVVASDTGAATTADPSVDEEMLADGEGMVGDADVLAEALAPENTETVETAEASPAEQDPQVAEATPGQGALLDPEDEIFLSTSDAPPPAFDALSLPAPAVSAEVAPESPMPPPPFGTVYAFDEQGLIVPQPQGILSPEGFMIYAGKPPMIPPERSPVATAAAEAARVAAETEAARTAAAAEPLVEALPLGEPAVAGEPSLAAEALGAVTAPAGPEAQPDPDLADRRPRARPENLVTTANDDEAALQGEDTAVVTASSLRPRARPDSVLAAAERARAETAAASLASAPALLDTSATVSPEDAANPSRMTISLRPAPKPRDFSRAVEAAVASAVRAPEATPGGKKAAASAPSREEQDEADEPEVAATPAPKIPTKASVAKQATFTKAINLSKINLIGVYGTPSKRYALVRMTNGKYRKVSVGDKIDGGRVEAITQSEVRYQKSGRLVSLAMPKT